MMGLGYWSNGGSSSSASNLSALAPPFTVERSNPKPTSNPLVNFTEPPYSAPYNSSSHNWQYPHSSASRPSFFSNPDSKIDVTGTTCLPAVNEYPYSVPLSMNSSSTHWGPSNPSAKIERDSLSYIPYSGDTPAGVLESKPYYSPYLSPVVENDNPLAPFNEPSYDLLSTSHVVPFIGSSQIDYTQSLSGLEYAPKWGGFWNGLTDGERSKRIELDGVFSSGEMNVAGSYVYSNYMKQGSHVAESSSKCEVGSFISHGKPVNAPGRENHSASSGLSILEPQASSLESATNSWNHQKSYAPSFEKTFKPFDYCMSNSVSVTRSPPALVIKPPATVPPETSNFIGDISASNNERPSSEDQERCFDTNRVSFDLERNDPIFVPPPSIRKVEPPKKLQVPDINAPYGSTLTGDSAKAVNSTESSSDSLDYHNPAEDSPCWKGAPASYFSSFEESTPPTRQHPIKTLEASFCSNLEGIQILSPCTDDSVRVSLQNLYESNMSLKNGCEESGSSLPPKISSSAICTVKDHGSDDEVAVRLNCMKLSGTDGLHIHHKIETPGKEHDLSGDSKYASDLKSSQPKDLSPKESDFTPKTSLTLQSDASGDGCVSIRGMKNISYLTSGEDASKLAKLCESESAPKMNAQMISNAIHNLSELLLFHCSNDACALSEHDNESLEHAIKNLDTCLSKNLVRVTPNQESTLPQMGISLELGELSDHGEGASAGGRKVTRKAVANVHAQHDYKCMPKEKWDDRASGKKFDKFWDFISLKDDADNVREDKMIQDIKKVLTENFHGEEDEQAQTLMYKDLWLEAEAALCSLSYRARFDRIKTEMEKSKSQKEKEVSEDTSPVEKQPSSDGSPDPNVTYKLTPEAEDVQIPDTSVHNAHPSSNTTCHVDDVESSVMARFQILKSRGESSNSAGMECKKPPEVVDAGFEGKRIHWPLVEDKSDAGSFGMGLGPHHVQRLHTGYSSRLEDVKEFHVCVSDDKMIPHNRLGSQQRPLGSMNDSSSLEWEHVLKEDILWQS